MLPTAGCVGCNGAPILQWKQHRKKTNRLQRLQLPHVAGDLFNAPKLLFLHKHCQQSSSLLSFSHPVRVTLWLIHASDARCGGMKKHFPEPSRHQNRTPGAAEPRKHCCCSCAHAALPQHLHLRVEDEETQIQWMLPLTKRRWQHWKACTLRQGRPGSWRKSARSSRLCVELAR